MSRAWQVTPVEDDSIEYEWQGWNVKTTWPRRGGRTEVIVVMTVRYTGIGGGLVVARKRVNVMSSSAMASIVTDMNRLDVTKRVELMYFMNDVTENLLYWYEQEKVTEYPDPRDVKTRVPWLVYPIWPATGVTGVAAAPGTYKSFMAEAISLGLAAQAPVLSRNTKIPGRARVLYLDWEADADTFARRLAALTQGAGLETKPWLGYKHMRARLSDTAIGLREMIVTERWDAVVIDSMSAAIGAGMVDDDAVNSFFDAIHMLDVPTLMLAHKSVANQNNRKARFFGSGMSEARVRMAWNAEGSANGDFVVWDCFKDNNHGKRGSKLAWEIIVDTEGDDEEETMRSVAFIGVNPSQVALDDGADVDRGRATVDDRILATLEQASGYLTIGQIAERIGTTEGTIRTHIVPLVGRYLTRRHRSSGRGYEYTLVEKEQVVEHLPTPY